MNQKPVARKEGPFITLTEEELAKRKHHSQFTAVSMLGNMFNEQPNQDPQEGPFVDLVNDELSQPKPISQVRIVFYYMRNIDRFL